MAAWWLTDLDAKPWLLMYGKIGNGKTTLGDSVLELVNTYLTIGPKVAVQGANSKETVRMVKVSAIEVERTAREEGEKFRKIMEMPMLFIDDWGTEPNITNNYGTMILPMANLIYYRYERRLMTILSANMDMGQIKKYYGERVMDRITEVCDMIGFNHKSYRK